MSDDAFSDRRKAYEEKFKRDHELQFKVTSRRNKLLGRWLGEKLGMTGSTLEDYAKSVVIADLAKPGDDDVVEKVMKDISEKGAAVTEKEVRAKLAELTETAKAQIVEELG